jgi:general L-amino acid transport system substrate-binding protein
MLSRNTTWTFTRDVDLKFTFAGVNYYDGQGFMVSKDLGVTSALELDGATVCVQTGTTTELNLADFFKVNNISYQPVPIQTPAEADQQFLGGACDAYTTDASQLATQRGTYENPDNYIILPEIISKEPLGPLVRQGDDQWADIVRWTQNALVAAEEYGVTAANAEEMTSSENPEIKRLLGAEGDLGMMLGLDADWAKRAIMAEGNYGEIFAKYIGEGTAPNIGRGLNALWTEGGLQYAPPFR